MVDSAQNEIEFLAILRPTSPLRTAGTISRAVGLLKTNLWADSLRGMEPTDKHPGKMWIVDENKEAFPFVNQIAQETPTHDRPTHTLPKVWVQNASLEIIRLKSLLETNTISGKRILSFELPRHEGFDVNTEEDWERLKLLITKDEGY